MNSNELLENYWGFNQYNINYYSGLFNKEVERVHSTTIFDHNQGGKIPKTYQTSLYDANDKLIGTIETQADGNYVMHNQNNLVFEKGKISDNGARKFKRYYTNGNNIAQVSMIAESDSNGMITAYDKYDYNKSGTLDSITEFYNGKLLGKIQYEYDDEGFKVSRKDYDSKGRIKHESLYDQFGNCASERSYDEDGNLTSNYVSEKMVFNGKEYSFNANELVSVIKSLETAKGSLSKTLGSIKDNCSSVASTVSSADSSLSSTLNSLGELCSKCSGVVDKLLSNLNTSIDNYITKTVANEEAVSRDVRSLGEEIDNISALFQSMD